MTAVVDAGKSTTLTRWAINVNPEAEIQWFGVEGLSRVVNMTKHVTPTWRQNNEEIT